MSTVWVGRGHPWRDAQTVSELLQGRAYDSPTMACIRLMTVCSLQGPRGGGLKENTGTMQRESEHRGLVCEEAGPSELGGCAPGNK